MSSRELIERHGSKTAGRRRLGQLLVDGGFITGEDLASALQEQKKSNKLLGEVLVQMGVIDGKDLEIVLGIQSELTSLEKAVYMAAGVRQVLGELLLQARRITSAQLDEALDEQRKTGELLGKVMVGRGLITGRELDAILEFQRHMEPVDDGAGRLRLGELLVDTGHVTRAQLTEALEQQKITKKKLGEILVESGYVRPEDIETGLSLQRRLTTAVLAALLSFATFSGIEEARAAESDGSLQSSKVIITARVEPHASLRIFSQQSKLVITAEDIARGYVEMRAATRAEVRNNSHAGYLLAIESGHEVPFRYVMVSGLGRDVQVQPGGGMIYQRHAGGPVYVELSFRFVLGADAQPGSYPWPLSLSAIPL